MTQKNKRIHSCLSSLQKLLNHPDLSDEAKIVGINLLSNLMFSALSEVSDDEKTLSISETCEGYNELVEKDFLIVRKKVVGEKLEDDYTFKVQPIKKNND